MHLYTRLVRSLIYYPAAWFSAYCRAWSMAGRVSSSAGSMPVSRVGVLRLVAQACAPGGRRRSRPGCPAYLVIAGSLSRGWNGTAGKAITGSPGAGAGGEELVGVGAPGGSPHDLEPGGQFLQPWAPWAEHSRTGWSPGEVVLGTCGRAGGSRDCVQGGVDVEQEQGMPRSLRADRAADGPRWQRRRGAGWGAAPVLAGFARRVIVAQVGSRGARRVGAAVVRRACGAGGIAVRSV